MYGLTELNREAIRSARLVANPGCYPTSVQLPLVPLLQQGLIEKARATRSKRSSCTRLPCHNEGGVILQPDVLAASAA